MKKWLKGLMSLVLALVLVFGLMPSRSFAENDSSADDRTQGGKGQYQVEWLPHKNDSGVFDGIMMHLRRGGSLDPSNNFYGPNCRSWEYNKNGVLELMIRSEHASYSEMDPAGYGHTLDYWLDEAERNGYNGNERRNDLYFPDYRQNDCYAKWNKDIPPDASANEWAIYINLTKRPQGTWGYFADTNDGGGIDGDDVQEFNIAAGEPRTLPAGEWQANWEKQETLIDQLYPYF